MSDGSVDVCPSDLIAARISNGIFFDHLQAKKGRRAASGGACDDRGIEAPRHSDQSGIETGRPTLDAAGCDPSEFVGFSLESAFSDSRPFPWRPPTFEATQTT